MSNNEILFNISSEYTLKSLFSYVKYNRLLKIIKYNKLLQKKLGIKLENYQIISNYQYIKRKIIRTYDPKEKECIEISKIFYFFKNFYFFCICFYLFNSFSFFRFI